MRWVKISLQYKILLGYLVLMAVIGSMTAILFQEQSRMREIETETAEIRRIRKNINIVHRRITELATRGESVIAWDEIDYREYCGQRLHIDSLLQSMKQDCSSFVSAEQIDTLRVLLEYKEDHLRRIMQAVWQQEKADSLLIHHLPRAVQQATYAQTTARKRKGIAGWFRGKKNKKEVIPHAEELHDLNEKLIAMQSERIYQIDLYTQSLRARNKELNQKLYSFINFLDNLAQDAFKGREEKMSQAQAVSFRLFSIVIGVAIILLLVSFLIIRYDIKKEEKSKWQLRQIINENEGLLDMRKKIILTLSHDIRGPLGNINNCAELASETREKKKREVYLDNIRRSCRHILHLVNNLLDVYKINEVKEVRNDIPFQLDKFLEWVGNNHARKANDKALIFESVHKGADVIVKGDADKIEQVLNNLLTNAIKFTISGNISFQSEYSDGKLYVEISDTGIGMDDQTLNRIFYPFERAAQDVNSEGFGLGLFITKGLMKILKGTIHVESKPGEGSQFRLVFPLPETSEEVENEEVTLQVPSVLPKRVLVVDDDAILLKIVEDMFGRNGVECTTCQNAQEAVNALRRLEYDLILTDMQMPVTDGFGLLKLLRSSDIGNSRTVPIAVMTARGDGESGVYEKSGFCGCIHKPFSMKGLLSFVTSITISPNLENQIFDYTRLMENTDDKSSMFELIIMESEKNLTDLEIALENGNCEAMRTVVHRMMPVWELLGADSVLSTYRNLLHEDKTDADVIKKYTLFVIAQIKILITESQNERKKDSYEQENIDS